MIPVPRHSTKSRSRSAPSSATARSRSTGTESCTSSASRAAWWLGRVRATQPGSHLEAHRHRRLHVLRHARHHPRRPHRLRAVLRPVVLDAKIRGIRIKVWDGGMSFHGGLLGVHDRVRDLCRPAQAPHRRRLRLRRAAAGHRHLRRAHRQLHQRRAVGQADRRALGLHRRRRVPLHATQLYEAALEGLLLFVILWWFTSKPRPRMAPAGLFLVIYSLSRIMVEFWRVPDAAHELPRRRTSAGSPWACC